MLWFCLIRRSSFSMFIGPIVHEHKILSSRFMDSWYTIYIFILLSVYIYYLLLTSVLNPYRCGPCRYCVFARSSPYVLIESTADALTSLSLNHIMLARSLVHTHALRSSVRSFTLSAPRFQAVPLEKPVLNKEFKIYRWVSSWTQVRFGTPTDHETT